jgi:hypothetical protein
MPSKIPGQATQPEAPATPKWEQILLDIEGAAAGFGAAAGGSIEERIDSVESTVNSLLLIVQGLVAVIKPPAAPAAPAPGLASK